MIPDWPAERQKMVQRQLRGRGIFDARVLAVMGQIPREEFVPHDVRIFSYRDEPAQIGFGQTISQPFITALMAERLELQGSELVLDVGTGSGYAAAVLGALSERVISIELIAGLARQAQENLRRTGWGRNVTIVIGDGSMGYAQEAPYDAIMVAAAAPDVPGPLVAQLRDPGRLVIPVGTRDDQSLMLVTKRNGVVERGVIGQCRFVPLRGNEGWN